MHSILHLQLTYRYSVLQTPHKPAFNFNLEALRGLAAAVVVWHHVIFYKRELDPNFTPLYWGAYNPPGHFAVLIFFLLSGYVIGRAHNSPLTKKDVRVYLRKRFVRLYPIYILAVLAGVFASGFRVPLWVIAENLVFGQGKLGPGIYENNPLWSLQHEVFFYLLFIPCSMLALSPWLVSLCSAGFGAAALLLLSPNGYLIELGPYLIGFSFWCLGWAFSLLPAQPQILWQRLLSALLLLMSVEYLNPLVTVMHKIASYLASHGIDTSHWEKPIIDVFDFADLPYAAIIVLCFAGVNGRFIRFCSLILQLLPAYGVLYALRHWQDPAVAPFLLPCIFYCASNVLYFFSLPALMRLSRNIIQRLIPLGAISYGLYVIHFPILTLFHRVTLFSGSALTFSVRAVAYTFLTLAAAYWLDKIFQPWVRRIIG